MTPEEIKEYLKSNLRIEVVPRSREEFRINLILENETISTDVFEIDD